MPACLLETDSQWRIVSGDLTNKTFCIQVSSFRYQWSVWSNGLEISVKIVLILCNSLFVIAVMCYLTLHVTTHLRSHLQVAHLRKTAARYWSDRYMVQGFKIICNNSLISDAFSGSVCKISDNRIMSVIEVLAGKPKGKRTVWRPSRGWEYNIKMDLK